uniref:Uncharacterized protein n=1 Tax=Glossina pallidipes TaxID=7398 RepID=A0A1B0AB00_GLOPL
MLADLPITPPPDDCEDSLLNEVTLDSNDDAKLSRSKISAVDGIDSVFSVVAVAVVVYNVGDLVVVRAVGDHRQNQLLYCLGREMREKMWYVGDDMVSVIAVEPDCKRKTVKAFTASLTFCDAFNIPPPAAVPAIGEDDAGAKGMVGKCRDVSSKYAGGGVGAFGLGVTDELRLIGGGGLAVFIDDRLVTRVLLPPPK